MAGEVWFSPAVRRGGAPVAGEHGRTVQESVFGIGTAGPQGTQDVRVRFAVAGVADVRGLRPGAIRRRVPHPGTFAAEEEQRPYVEFAAADLPWRYSPGLDGAGRVAPWLLLVVGLAEHIQVVGSRAVLAPEVLAGHDPLQAALWAHVQHGTAAADPAAGTARVLCARVFPPGGTFDAGRDHIAALVVPWRADGAAAWVRGQGGPADVLCVDSWRFRTGPAGGFKDLAMQLEPGDDDPLGTVAVVIDDNGTTLAVPGALTTALPAGPPQAAGLRFDLLDAEPVDGRAVVGPPAYGAPWLGEDTVRDRTRGAEGVAPPQWRWPEQVNADLARRVVAAAGRQAGIDLQEEIVIAAARAWRAGPAVSSVLSGLALGLSASAALWRQRLPDDATARAVLLGPAAGRIPTEGPGGDGQTLREALARPDEPDRQPYPVSLLGPTGRRALRAGAPTARLARPGAADVGSVAAAATKVEEVPDRPQDTLAAGADPEDLDPAHLDAVAAFAEQQLGPAAIAELLREFENTAEMEGHDPHPGGDPPARRPIDLTTVAGLLGDVLDPTGALPPARRRVVGRVQGIDPRRALQPLEDCPDLDLPAWRYLRDRAPQWLLPGAETLSAGEVVSLRTNPEFVEQFLTGLNQQAVAELRWRQHPVRAGCTPLRRFWDRTPGPAGRRDDIVGIAGWVDADGEPAGRQGEHQPPDVVPERLVVVVRSELFRRYPATLVSLAAGATPGQADRPANLAAREWPEFVAALSDDLTMFAFRTDPDLAAQRWIVVEEVPDGIRFTTETPPPTGPGSDGATTAAALVLKPVRVLLNGAETIPGAGP